MFAQWACMCDNIISACARSENGYKFQKPGGKCQFWGLKYIGSGFVERAAHPQQTTNSQEYSAPGFSTLKAVVRPSANGSLETGITCCVEEIPN